MFQLIRPGTNIDFVGKRKIWMAISVVCVVATTVLFFTKGLNYGIDFTGGAEVQLRVPKTFEISKMRATLEDAGIKGLKVQEIEQALTDTNPQREFLIKAQGDEGSLGKVAGSISEAMTKVLGAGQFEVVRSDVVGPAAGSSLRTSGFLSMLYALLCILIYVSIRFDMRYSPGAVLALFHDTAITLGIFIVTQKQFDLQILAAILALIGYSNNDTIIVYDRVRETLQGNPGMKIEAAVNHAINETLGRTFLTSFTTFLTVFALWALGGKVIEDFAFTLMVGIVVGAYSSVMIAGSIVIFMSNLQDKREANPKKGGAPKKKTYQVRPDPKLT